MTVISSVLSRQVAGKRTVFLGNVPTLPSNKNNCTKPDRASSSETKAMGFHRRGEQVPEMRAFLVDCEEIQKITTGSKRGYKVGRINSRVHVLCTRRVCGFCRMIKPDNKEQPREK